MPFFSAIAIRSAGLIPSHLKYGLSSITGLLRLLISDSTLRRSSMSILFQPPVAFAWSARYLIRARSSASFILAKVFPESSISAFGVGSAFGAACGVAVSKSLRLASCCVTALCSRAAYPKSNNSGAASSRVATSPSTTAASG